MPWSKLPPERVSELYAEARRLYVLFDNLPALIAYWDADLHNVIANEAYVEWFGLTPAAMRGMHIRNVLGEDVYAKNLPFIEGALAGNPQLFERTLVDTNGNTRHTQASYVPDLDDGEVRGFYVLVTDITPRVEAQRAMDEAQALAGVGSWSINNVTGEVTWSDHLYRLLGLDPESTTSSIETFLALIHPDDVAGATQRAQDRSLAYESEYRIIRPDGEIRELITRNRPHLGPDGTLLGATGTVQDVTESNRRTRELNRINDELTQVNRLNADVLGMLGHDVRQPITVMLGYLDELDDSFDSLDAGQLRSYLATTRRAAARLRRLVDNILAMATLDGGRIATHPQPVALAELVREVIADGLRNEEVGIEIADDVTAYADPFHLRQILANLLSNAVRHGAPPFRICAVNDADGTTIRVCDQGAGVPAEFVDHLFERFSRASDPNELRPGTGFGLHLVAELARTNGGSVGYTAGEQGGSVFTVKLPGPPPSD